MRSPRRCEHGCFCGGCGLSPFLSSLSTGTSARLDFVFGIARFFPSAQFCLCGLCRLNRCRTQESRALIPIDTRCCSCRHIDRSTVRGPRSAVAHIATLSNLGSRLLPQAPLHFVHVALVQHVFSLEQTAFNKSRNQWIVLEILRQFRHSFRGTLLRWWSSDERSDAPW